MTVFHAHTHVHIYIYIRIYVCTYFGTWYIYVCIYRWDYIIGSDLIYSDDSTPHLMQTLRHSCVGCVCVWVCVWVCTCVYVCICACMREFV